MTVELREAAEPAREGDLGGQVNSGFEVEVTRVANPEPLFPKAAVPPNDPLVKYLKAVIAETASVESGSVDKPVQKGEKQAEPVLPPYLSPPLTAAAICPEARENPDIIASIGMFFYRRNWCNTVILNLDLNFRFEGQQPGRNCHYRRTNEGTQDVSSIFRTLKPGYICNRANINLH